MTYKQLQDEVIDLRFDESKRAKVKSWINIGYQRLWAYRNWSFKNVAPVGVTATITNNIASLAAPADFAKVTALYSPTTGDRMRYLPPDLWDENYRTPLGLSSGIAGDFTVVDRNIFVGPAQAGSFPLAYKRRLAHVDPNVGVIGGVMVNDGDQPLWPAEHDYLLIFEAAVQGEDLTDGLGSSSLMQRRDEALLSMVKDLAGPQAPGIRVWGASDVDATDVPIGWGY